MRHVYPNHEVPHLWAHQTQDEARNSTGSFYVNGQTIYSYGFAFPHRKTRDQRTWRASGSVHYGAQFCHHFGPLLGCGQHGAGKKRLGSLRKNGAESKQNGSSSDMPHSGIQTTKAHQAGDAQCLCLQVNRCKR